MADLSILIPSLVCRAALLNRLRWSLWPQLTERVKVHILSDDGEETTGAKRNRLLDQADTDYVCFVDDDDDVAFDYVAKIAEALRAGPDVVTFRQRIYDDGQYTETVTRRVGGKHPNHLSPIRIDIARAIGFPDRNCGEDVDYAERLSRIPLIESFIDHDLYFYLRRSDRRWERQNHNP